MVETMEAPSMISQDMLREQERQEWEKQAQQEHIPGIYSLFILS